MTVDGCLVTTIKQKKQLYIWREHWISKYLIREQPICFYSILEVDEPNGVV